jgi:hypothetical protein
MFANGRGSGGGCHAACRSGRGDTCTTYMAHFGALIGRMMEATPRSLAATALGTQRSTCWSCAFKLTHEDESQELEGTNKADGAIT